MMAGFINGMVFKQGRDSLSKNAAKKQEAINGENLPQRTHTIL